MQKETLPNIFDGSKNVIPCKRPGGPHPGCPDPSNNVPIPANPYKRGCSGINLCRGG